MFHVLLVEDEPSLRDGLTQGLSRMDGVRVTGVGTVDAALAVLNADEVQLVITDINLPERSGLELVAELSHRDPRPPVVAMTAYKSAFEGQLKLHPGLEVLDKPVPLSKLRELIEKRRRDGQSPSQTGPFGLLDYLQLAGLGRHSLTLRVRLEDHREGVVEIWEGEIWNARVGSLEGEAAMAEMLRTESTDLTTAHLLEEPAQRALTGSIQGLLLDLAHQEDEKASQAAASHTDIDNMPTDEIRRALLSVSRTTTGVSEIVLLDLEEAEILVQTSPSETHTPESPRALLELAHLVFGPAAGAACAQFDACGGSGPTAAWLAVAKGSAFFSRGLESSLALAMLAGPGVKQGVGWMLMRDMVSTLRDLGVSGLSEG